MIDLVVRGGMVGMPNGAGARDVAIEGKHIASVSAKDSVPVPDGARLVETVDGTACAGDAGDRRWLKPRRDSSVIAGSKQ